MTFDLTSLREQALAGIKSAFVTKRQRPSEGLVVRKASLQAQGGLLVLRKAEYRSKFLAYSTKVEGKRMWLVQVCKE